MPDQIDKEVNDLLLFIARQLKALLPEEKRGTTRKAIAKLWGFASSKNFCDFERYGQEVLEGQNPNPLFRHTYRMLRGILGRPPILLRPLQPIIIVPGQTPMVPGWVRPDEYLAVPLVEGQIAAGSGRIVQEDLEGFLWLHKEDVGNRVNLVAVRLARDAISMEPTLRPGDIVVIDRDDKVIVPTGLYAVRTGPEGCSVKRIRVARQGIWLLSDNQAFPPELSEYESLEDLVIGRVVWSCRKWQ